MTRETNTRSAPDLTLAEVASELPCITTRCSPRYTAATSTAIGSWADGVSPAKRSTCTRRRTGRGHDRARRRRRARAAIVVPVALAVACGATTAASTTNRRYADAPIAGCTASKPRRQTSPVRLVDRRRRGGGVTASTEVVPVGVEPAPEPGVVTVGMLKALGLSVHEPETRALVICCRALPARPARRARTGDRRRKAGGST